MANYYFTLPDSVTLPTDGSKVSLTTACELHRDDSAVPNALTVAADSYNVFLADTPGTGTATAPDVTAPTISSSVPTDNATDVAITSNIVITFDENIQFGTGNITLRDNDGGWADLEVFDVTTDTGGGAGTVSISGAVLTIEPTADLANSIEYAIRIDATAIDDTATSPNSFAGIADDTTLSFTTVASAASVADQIATELGAKTMAVFDFTDFTTMKQLANGTTDVTAAAQAVRYIVDSNGSGIALESNSGNAITTASDGVKWNEAHFEMVANPSWDTAEDKTVLVVFDTDDGTGTDDPAFIFLGKKGDGAFYAGNYLDADTGAVNAGFGSSIAYSVNDETDLTTTTPDSFFDPVSAKSGFRTVAIRNLNLSHFPLLLMSYNATGASYRFDGRVKYIVIADDPTPTQLTNIHTILGI